MKPPLAVGQSFGQLQTKASIEGQCSPPCFCIGTQHFKILVRPCLFKIQTKSIFKIFKWCVMENRTKLTKNGMHRSMGLTCAVVWFDPTYSLGHRS